MTAWLSAREQRAWRAYLTAARLLFEAMDRQLQREAGMPHTYYEILVRLSEAPDRTLRMSELAAQSRSSRSRLSHAVTRLEQQGWIERRACPSDRRGQFAVLTDAGFTALAAAAPGHVATVRSALFDALTPTQVDQLHTISEAIIQAAGSTRPAAVAD